LDPATKWTVNFDQNASSVILKHEILGTLTLRISIPFDNVVQIQSVTSDTTLRRLERLARPGDTDDQIALAQKRIDEIKQSMKEDGDTIKQQNVAMTDAWQNHSYRQRYKSTGNIYEYRQVFDSTGQSIVNAATATIKACNDHLNTLSAEQTSLQTQIAKLKDGTVGRQLKTMSPSVLAAVNPLVLTIETSGNKPGTIELTMVNAQGNTVPTDGDNPLSATPPATIRGKTLPGRIFPKGGR